MEAATEHLVDHHGRRIRVKAAVSGHCTDDLLEICDIRTESGEPLARWATIHEQSWSRDLHYRTPIAMDVLVRYGRPRWEREPVYYLSRPTHPVIG